MTNISLPQAELKLFLDQHHEVLKDASFFMASNDRGTLDLVQGLHTATAKMFSNIEPPLPGTENNHEGRAHQRNSFKKRRAFNCDVILDFAPASFKQHAALLDSEFGLLQGSSCTAEERPPEAVPARSRPADQGRRGGRHSIRAAVAAAAQPDVP